MLNLKINKMAFVQLIIFREKKNVENSMLSSLKIRFKIFMPQFQLKHNAQIQESDRNYCKDDGCSNEQ